ncbi:serine hydrolase domain-containing protein [Streptomyces sp. NPDC056549]|uniref:serine hydrolase domain-containing protein n=1 Tax=Streptomyces sp. NPDC056549 TaxID=3345864 RepID=UPI0036942864
MHPAHAHLAAIAQTGVTDRTYPGVVWAVGDTKGVQSQGVAGVLDPADPTHPMTNDTVFDMASLTKILAVWSTIGTLWQDGSLPLDTALGDYWPEVTGRPLGKATARQLLTHTAGVPLRANLRNLYGADPTAIRHGVLTEELHRPPGEAVEYTDRAALILGYLAERLSGQPLDTLATTRVWQPLAMNETSFGPLNPTTVDRCAPTEKDQDTGTHLKGVVHDFSARLLGGVCGIAGTFSTITDTARFLQYLLHPESAPARPGFGAEWITESLTVHTADLEPARGLFWHPAPGTDPADGIYVHYGFTGTAMWISPKHGRWGALLTNKLYLTRDREPLATLRSAFREAIYL